MTREMTKGTWVPNLPGTVIPASIVVAIVVVVGVHLLLTRTAIGYHAKILGLNIRAAKYAGVNIKRVTIILLLLSGGLAGLAGVLQVGAIQHRYQAEWSPGYGFDAIPLVFIGQLTGIGTILSSFLFAFLLVGGALMYRATNVPVFFIRTIEGLVLVFFAIGEYLRRR
jgi:ABC-type uncharacterized transport system permease subunit